MQWGLIVALIIAIPIILFPVAFIWYINIGGIYAAIKRARERRTAEQQKGADAKDIEQIAAATINKDQFV
ncbi:hypothetical protein ACFLYM_02330 [Chloroflexota bacterium]